MQSFKIWGYPQKTHFLQQKTELKQTNACIEISIHSNLSVIVGIPFLVIAWYFLDSFITKLTTVVFTLISFIRYGLVKRLSFNRISKEVEISQIFLNRYVWSHRHFQYHDAIELIVKEEYDSDSDYSYNLYIHDEERDRFLVTLSSLTPFLELKELLEQEEVIFYGQPIKLLITLS